MALDPSNSSNLEQLALNGLKIAVSELTRATGSFEIKMNTSSLFLFLLVFVFADDDGHALARQSGLDQVALTIVVEVHSDTAGVVDTGALTVDDG